MSGAKSLCSLPTRATIGVLLLSVLAAAPSAEGQLPAFPGAEGFGGAAPAGGFFGADVYHVTKLDDILNLDDPNAVGTLRHAVRPSGIPVGGRIVVFDVGGTIQLNGKLDLAKNTSKLYIAGQTAPSPVTLYGNQAQVSSSTGEVTNDVVIRYLTFRKGDGPENDALTFTGTGLASNVILDHISASWSEDEVMSVGDNNTDATIQYSLFTEALNNNAHAFGSLIRADIASNVTYHHNYFSNNISRNPRPGSYNAELLTFDFRNNVVYNWRDRPGYSGGSTETDREKVDMNFVGNYYVAGPSTTGFANHVFLIDKSTDVRAYQSNNLSDGNGPAAPDGETPDGTGVYNGVDNGWNMWQVFSIPNAGTLQQRVAPFATAAVTTQSPVDAFNQVINHSGNFWWDRDEIDARLMDEALNYGGGIINAPDATELANLLAAPMTIRPAEWDTDNDGMPDDWEVAHGLNPAADDHAGDFDSDGYTNLEEYVNEAGAFPAPADIIYDGPTSSPGNRYTLIANWNIPFQPSRFDTAVIHNGTVVVDAVGQHTGVLRVAPDGGDNATLDVTSGWLQVADSLVVGAGGTLRVAGSSTLVTAANVSIATGGSLSLNSGTLVIDGGTFDFDNGGATFSIQRSGLAPGVPTLRLDRGAVWSEPTLNVTVGFSSAPGRLEVLDGSQAVFNQLTIMGGGSLVISGGSQVTSLTGTIRETSIAGEVRRVEGSSSLWQITGSGAALAVEATGPTALLEIRDGARVLVSAGNLNIGTSSATTGAVTVSGAEATLEVAGSVNVGNTSPFFGGTGSLNVEAGSQVIVSGALNVGDGDTISFTGGTIDAATLNLTSAAVFNWTGGTLHADTIGGNVTNDGGTLAPGDSTGVTNISGTYTQNASGTLHIELAGTMPGNGYDQINGTAAVNLGGTLDVELIDDFVPALGDTFEFLTAAGGISSTFDTELLPTLSGNLVFDVIYGANSVSLVAVLPGDYNFDGNFDAADYVIWRANDGTQEGYDTWRANFGNMAGGGAGSALGPPSQQNGVPEPAAVVLLLFAVVGCVGCPRKFFKLSSGPAAI